MIGATRAEPKVCPVTGQVAVGDLADRSTAEWLVATAVRCRMAGYEFHDINCWELGADLLEERIGAAAPLVEAELAAFVRKLRRLMSRPFLYHPHPTKALSGDEALLLELIARAGADDPATLAQARTLTPTHAETLVTLASDTAKRLAKAGLRLDG